MKPNPMDTLKNLTVPVVDKVFLLSEIKQTPREWREGVGDKSEKVNKSTRTDAIKNWADRPELLIV